MAATTHAGVYALRADRCAIVPADLQGGPTEIHVDGGFRYPVAGGHRIALAGNLLLVGPPALIRHAEQTTHQETPEMDRSITARNTNPADRLDEACYNLADYKCFDKQQLTTYQLVLMVEALREEADQNPDFDAALADLARRIEARMQHLTEAA